MLLQLSQRYLDITWHSGIDTGFLAGGGDKMIMLECQTCIRYVIMLAILHILIDISLTKKAHWTAASWLFFYGFQWE